MVYLALHLVNRDSSIYAGPERFDPGRFGSGTRRAPHASLAFIPQGLDPPTSRCCLGLEYSTPLTLGFLAVLGAEIPEHELPGTSVSVQ